MSDILWQTFNDTYTDSIRNSSFNNYSDKVLFNNYSDKVLFNNYSDKVSFNNYSDKHFWKMIYNILIKILPYIHSNYERYMMNKFHIHFTTFTSQHSSKSGNDSSTNFHHIIHHILSQIFRNKLSDRYFIKSSSQHLFQHSFHTSFNNLWNNSSTHHSSYLHPTFISILHHKLSDKTFTTFFIIVHSTIEYGSFISAYPEF